MPLTRDSAHPPLAPNDNDSLHRLGSTSSSSLALLHHPIYTTAERLYHVGKYGQYSILLVPKLASVDYWGNNSICSIGKHGGSSSYHQLPLACSDRRIEADVAKYQPLLQIHGNGFVIATSPVYHSLRQCILATVAGQCCLWSRPWQPIVYICAATIVGRWNFCSWFPVCRGNSSISSPYHHITTALVSSNASMPPIPTPALL